MTFEGVGDLMYAYAADKAEDVPSIVEGFYGAGRLNHGDIDFVIPDETVVTNGHQQPLPALASILDAYTSGVVKVFFYLCTRNHESQSWLMGVKMY